MDSNEDQRCYWVTVANEGEEPSFVERFDTLHEAIKEARSRAWDVEGDASVTVTDDLGDDHWNNEGDWKNASF